MPRGLARIIDMRAQALPMACMAIALNNMLYLKELPPIHRWPEPRIKRLTARCITVAGALDEALSITVQHHARVPVSIWIMFWPTQRTLRINDGCLSYILSQLPEPQRAQLLRNTALAHAML